MLELEGFHGQTISIPEDLLYYKEQELWVKPGQEFQTLIFGFTQAAVALISGFTYLEFIAGLGDFLQQGSPVFAVDTYKVSFELYSPVSGKVVYLNQGLEGAGAVRIEEDPYGIIIFGLEVSEGFDPKQYFLDAKGYFEALEAGCVSICGS